ncbi:MAG: hypothetical protein M3P30_02840 [Chloroflexota bacterium]|nr:hypothetical protein [Chloroflexota bacterium]
MSDSLNTDINGFLEVYRDSDVVLTTANEVDVDEVRRISTPALIVAIARILQADESSDATKIAIVVAVVLAGQKLARAEKMALESLTEATRSSQEGPGL